MSEKTACGFLEYILAHPDDDGPRLVFADWLEEQGDSDRAEFIRVQIERTRLPEWDARQIKLRLRERTLLERHARTWRQELPAIENMSWGEFRRGFVAIALFENFAVLRKNASACWAAAPLESVAIRWPRPRESVASMTPIAGLRELTFHGRLVNFRDMDRLAQSPLLSTLRALTVSHGSMQIEGFRRLLASPHLGNLKALRMPGNSIGNAAAEALANAVSLTALEELNLSEENNYGRYGEDTVMEPVGVEALATWPGMDRLRSLDLSGNSIGSEGLRALLRSPRAVGLKTLILRTNGLDGQAMKEFSSARPELQLDHLDLGDNLLRDLGAEELANAACLRQLKVLDLEGGEIGESGARRLAEAPFLGTLRRLNVNSNSFGAEGLRALLKANPSHLHTISLVYNNVGDEGAAHLAASPASDSLLEVNLVFNQLGDPAAEALARSRHLRNLLLLYLSSNRISREARAALADSSLAKRLANLSMDPMHLARTGDDDDIPF